MDGAGAVCKFEFGELLCCCATALLERWASETRFEETEETCED